jgi:hypothetical protein
VNLFKPRTKFIYFFKIYKIVQKITLIIGSNSSPPIIGVKSQDNYQPCIICFICSKNKVIELNYALILALFS